MATAVFDPILKTSSGNPNRRNVAPRKTPPPHPVLGKIALLAVLAGLVTVVTLAISVETSKEMALPGGVTTFIGSMTGIVGMYLALVMVLVVARIPALERILGQDGMLRWHRRLSPWPISLLIAHAIFVTIGYAQAAKTGSLHELGNLINSYPDVLAATVGLGLMVLIGIASIRAIRTRLKRETWWVLHLYIYLALALSFAHVLALGPSFVGHPLVRLFWSVIWAATAGTVIVYRFGIPIFRSFKFGLTVQEVIREGPDVVSVILKGKKLETLAVSGGQFFAWRFLTRGLWWQAHPYSLSALPRPPYLRLTVKQIGDHSRAVAQIRPGTKVAIEGPYGAVTHHVRRHQKVALIAGGIGITALRSLLEDLPKESRPAVIMRARSSEELVFKQEVAELIKHRRGTLQELVGSRTEVDDLEKALKAMIPDIRQRDVYVCGPPGMVEDAVAAAKRIGVSHDSIHFEIYSW